MADRLLEDEVYLRMCFNLATLSYAERLKVGELLLTPQGIIIPGVNGTAPGTPNECEYEDEDGKLVSHPYVICGAQNSINKAARQGVKVEGSTLYSTDSPCPKCTHNLISVGVIRVVYARKYRLTDHLKLLTDNGISLDHIPINI